MALKKPTFWILFVILNAVKNLRSFASLRMTEPLKDDNHYTQDDTLEDVKS